MDVKSGYTAVGMPDEGKRIDAFLSGYLGVSRSRIQSMLSSGLVLVNGSIVKKNRVLRLEDRIEWSAPEPVDICVAPESIPVVVVYEDEHIVVIDKTAGLVMYPGPGHRGGTLLNALLERYPELNDVGGRGRSGIFHRLDKDTSGLVAVARTGRSYDEMVKKMKSREVERNYIALVKGNIPADSGTIDAPVGRSRADRKKMAVKRETGKRAVSKFQVMERFLQGYSLLSVSLETGRTHQIRVHFAHIGYPVVGDKTYSRGNTSSSINLNRQFLHAAELKFEHPVTGKTVKLKSELPEDLSKVVRELRAGNTSPAE